MNTFQIIGIILFFVMAIILITMMIMLRPGRTNKHNTTNK